MTTTPDTKDAKAPAMNEPPRATADLSATPSTLPPTAAVPPPRRRYLMLALATLGFALNFWAWALLSPLGPRFQDSLRLSAFEDRKSVV